AIYKVPALRSLFLFLFILLCTTLIKPGTGNPRSLPALIPACACTSTFPRQVGALLLLVHLLSGTKIANALPRPALLRLADFTSV
ncbi:MAG: hypothetical protein ABIU77_07815, partial [Ferruginibacter sp.]